jgi:hypothetical protein
MIVIKASTHLISKSYPGALFEEVLNVLVAESKLRPHP